MMSSLFADILPSGAVSVETRKHLKWVALFPEEQHAIRRAGSKRRAEFISARACAREALAQIGFPGLAVPKGFDGGPIWPGGVVGSVTHCAGLRAVAVVRRGRFAALGIDAEPEAPLPPGVLPAISTRRERAKLRWAGLRIGTVAPDRLLFSAKEAAFKCLCGAGADAADFASVRIALGWGTFIAMGGTRRQRLTGRWHVRDGFICAVAVADAAPDITQILHINR